MATLVLTTVGSLVAGPVGGAIGALVGSGIDRTLLAPEGRRGPRLGELAVQGSAYGAPIPKLFGTMRVAGTVIWATDLKETRTRDGGGKGRPARTGYSYSASFAVALSGRRLRGVKRIWADGKLLRGTGGDWKGATGFRFHDGAEDQAADPLIAAAEGLGQTPAYRGVAYAVFEDMALAEYGNRIPSLSFEVEADAGPVTVGAIAAALADGAIADATETTVAGYAASGDSVRGAIETLAAAAPVSLVDDGAVMSLSEGGGAALRVPVEELGTAAGAKGAARREVRRRAAGTLPDEVAIAHYAPERDYQAGLQRARRGGPGRRVRTVELPAVLAAGDAKRIAERRLAADWAGGREAVLRLPWRWMNVRPGTAAALDGSAEGWRVAGVALDRMVVELRLVGTAEDAGVTPPAAPGRALAQADAPHGPTTLAVFELPPVGDAIETAPRLMIAAAGASPGWRSAMLERSGDGGATLEPIGRTAAAATMGTVAEPLGPGSDALFDDVAVMEVELLNGAMLLEGRSDEAMLAGANLALVGAELIQFGAAEQVGQRRFRLSRLLRGRRGTEAAIAGHGPGERFVLIEPETLVDCPLPLAAMGTEATVIATGIGDAEGAEARTVVAAPALRPPSPVHLSAVRDGAGGVWIGWVRRSRAGWAWVDGVDAPLGEERERYRLTIRRAGGSLREVETVEPRFRYDAAAMATDGNAGAAALAVTVVQLGGIAASAPAEALLVL